MLFELGMMYSVGRDVPVDLISAHKWFNLAAVKGNTEAIRLRREVADQMSDAEIAVAQRAARDWLRGNHQQHATTVIAPALAALKPVRVRQRQGLRTQKLYMPVKVFGASASKRSQRSRSSMLAGSGNR